MADTVLPAQVIQRFAQPRGFKGSRKGLIFQRDLYLLLITGIFERNKGRFACSV